MLVTSYCFAEISVSTFISYQHLIYPSFIVFYCFSFFFSSWCKLHESRHSSSNTFTLYLLTVAISFGHLIRFSCCAKRFICTLKAQATKQKLDTVVIIKIGNFWVRKDAIRREKRQPTKPNMSSNYTIWKLYNSI